MGPGQEELLVALGLVNQTHLFVAIQTGAVRALTTKEKLTWRSEQQCNRNCILIFQGISWPSTKHFNRSE